MVIRLGHICLGTSNLDKTISFYTRFCDGEIVHKFENHLRETYGVMLRIGESSTFIELFNDQELRASSEKGSFRHLNFQVKDIFAVQKKLIEEGFTCPISRGRTDSILQCWCEDPEGNQIEFSQYDEQAEYRF